MTTKDQQGQEKNSVLNLAAAQEREQFLALRFASEENQSILQVAIQC